MLRTPLHTEDSLPVEPHARPTMREILAHHNRKRPPLTRAWMSDALSFAAHRGERWEFRSQRAKVWTAIRLLWDSDDYAGVALYRLRAALHAHHVPVLPRILHGICSHFFGIRIGANVTVGEGLYLPHGNVVIDGVCVIGDKAVIAPWSTIGTRQDSEFFGPTIGDGVQIGTGARVLGDVTVGDAAHIGANAVVLQDVPPRVLVAGVPARVVKTLDGAVAE